MSPWTKCVLLRTISFVAWNSLFVIIFNGYFKSEVLLSISKNKFLVVRWLIKKQVGVRIIGPSRQIEEVRRWSFDFAPLNFHPAERSDASLKKTRQVLMLHLFHIWDSIINYKMHRGQLINILAELKRLWPFKNWISPKIQVLKKGYVYTWWIRAQIVERLLITKSRYRWKHTELIALDQIKIFIFFIIFWGISSSQLFFLRSRNLSFNGYRRLLAMLDTWRGGHLDNFFFYF